MSEREMGERRRIIEGFSPAERRLFVAMGGRLPVETNRRESEMLVLSRQRDEVIEIQNPDGTVLGTVTLVDIRGDKVRLGLNFPLAYRVHRKEVADAIRRGAVPVRVGGGDAIDQMITKTFPSAVASGGYVTPERK